RSGCAVFQSIMAEETPVEAKEDVPEIVPFDPSKKKKKKKVVLQDLGDDAANQLSEKTENISSIDPKFYATFSGDLFWSKQIPRVTGVFIRTRILMVQLLLLLSGTYFYQRMYSSLSYWKLSNHYAKDVFFDYIFLGPISEDEEGEGHVLQPQYPWEGSNRDYVYEELLGRVFHILRENNPELAGDRRRTVMRPPQVLREGTKKTVFVNFMDLCKTMHRQPEHVMNFLLAEMGTSGSLDGQQRLVVKGRFAPKNFEGILRRYINEYVICNGCRSPDTILSKENRLFFLRCEQCGSGRSVAPIKTGFVARVGRRKAGT
ncbi:hypothetical protein RJ639_005083, partial [Escallonia herrerae]